ncbi:MAG TPA: GIY-YIG nuclease family protein [Bacteroidia bacterium]|nr:GIY-YIG nuclease family protein [Bacteroidia bacterium]
MNELPELIMKADRWVLYLIRCADDSIYTGITNNLEARIQAHNTGKGAKYTRGRAPVLLLAVFEYDSKSEASKAEYAMKKCSRGKKLALIAGHATGDLLDKQFSVGR